MTVDRDGLRPAGANDADAAVAPWRRPSVTWIPPALLAVAMVTYTWWMTKTSLDVHHGLGTSSYDSALYDQGVWLMSRFDAPFVTLMGRNLMGDHASFILVFLVPLYWVFPAAGTLFFTQSAALALAALPVYLTAQARLHNAWYALVLGCCFLLHPAVGHANLENFHPDSYVAVFVGLAIYGALQRKWRLYAVAVVLALLVKEDVSLVIVPLGIWVGVKRDRRIGIVTIVGSVAFMLAAMFLVMRSLIGVPTRNGWRIPFGGPGGLVKESLSQPGNVFDYLRSENRPWYVWKMLTPFAWIYVRRPWVALIGGVVLVSNMISTFYYQFHLEYHYSLIIVPALAIGAVYAIESFGPRGRTYAVIGVAAASLLSANLWSPLPGTRYVSYYWPPDHPVAVALRDILPAVPDDASVSAYHRVTPHMAHRREIYQFPNPFRVVLYGTDLAMEGTRLDERADGVEYVVLPRQLDPDLEFDWDVISPAFDVVAENEHWVVYERDRDVELPPLQTPPPVPIVTSTTLPTPP